MAVASGVCKAPRGEEGKLRDSTEKQTLDSNAKTFPENRRHIYIYIHTYIYIWMYICI